VPLEEKIKLLNCNALHSLTLSESSIILKDENLPKSTALKYKTEPKMEQDHGE